MTMVSASPTAPRCLPMRWWSGRGCSRTSRWCPGSRSPPSRTRWGSEMSCRRHRWERRTSLACTQRATSPIRRTRCSRPRRAALRWERSSTWTWPRATLRLPCGPRSTPAGGTSGTAPRAIACGVAHPTDRSWSSSGRPRRGRSSTSAAVRAPTRSGSLSEAGPSRPSTSPRSRSNGHVRPRQTRAPRSSGCAATCSRRRLPRRRTTW
jgi:hypothetical protein